MSLMKKQIKLRNKRVRRMTMDGDDDDDDDASPPIETRIVLA
jgi:hypothetical protein